ncbi:hypothetical protein DY000_02012722 [Brassica cretica]|uniref:Uncharacterized protein n=1 Tax=Brassica cretica TaxID=69181 RepID=A0ABQ7D8N1_BRACR|nr:hypothetical protein DY000_02012722 [Brassica cretica]
MKVMVHLISPPNPKENISRTRPSAAPHRHRERKGIDGLVVWFRVSVFFVQIGESLVGGIDSFCASFVSFSLVPEPVKVCGVLLDPNMSLLGFMKDRTKPALMWVVTSSIGFGETSGLGLSSEFFEFLVKEWSMAVFEEPLMRTSSYGVCSYWGLSSIRWPLLTLEFDCLVWSLRSFGAVWM